MVVSRTTVVSRNLGMVSLPDMSVSSVPKFLLRFPYMSYIVPSLAKTKKFTKDQETKSEMMLRHCKGRPSDKRAPPSSSLKAHLGL